MSFWYKPCPVCDGQGRLEIMKNIDEKILMAEEEIKQLQNKRKKHHFLI